MESLVLGCLYGAVQGFRHAFEPDHLTAVSTMVAEQRNARASVYFATMWGVGHALVLLLVGGALFLFRTEMPERVTEAFELVVGIVLVLLGLRAVRVAARRGEGGAPFEHRHNGLLHSHAGDVDHVHLSSRAMSTRPLLVGIVHGLAGSGALTAFALTRSQSSVHGLVLIALYGASATLGMATLSGIIGLPLARVVRNPAATRILLSVSGGVSIVLGFMWAGPIAAHWINGSP